jgi:environmental stress-induced protein Ves
MVFGRDAAIDHPSLFSRSENLMKASHLSTQDYRRMPWKNGQGSTTELIAAPAGDGSFNWRLSIADVGQSGPFSDFSGYDRFITLIDGNGMVLTFNGSMERRIDEAYTPLPFDGGWQTDCRLIDGPIRDFNLMVSRRWGYGSMTILHPQAGEKCEIGEAPVVLLHVFDGVAEFDHGAMHVDLVKGNTLHLDQPADSLLTATGNAVIAAIYLEPKS